MNDNTKLDRNLKLKLLEAFIFASPEPVKFNLLKQSSTAIGYLRLDKHSQYGNKPMQLNLVDDETKTPSLLQQYSYPT